MERVTITTPFIKLDSFLKFCGVMDTGGQLKLLITGGKVLVNGEICTMRGKKLYGGETVALPELGTSYLVEKAQ